eukprot:gene12137-biopygen13995
MELERGFECQNRLKPPRVNTMVSERNMFPTRCTGPRRGAAVAAPRVAVLCRAARDARARARSAGGRHAGSHRMGRSGDPHTKSSMGCCFFFLACAGRRGAALHAVAVAAAAARAPHLAHLAAVAEAQWEGEGGRRTATRGAATAAPRRGPVQRVGNMFRSLTIVFPRGGFKRF